MKDEDNSFIVAGVATTEKAWYIDQSVIRGLKERLKSIEDNNASAEENIIAIKQQLEDIHTIICNLCNMIENPKADWAANSKGGID